MALHSLTRPLTVEPSLDPPDAAYIECIDCGELIEGDRELELLDAFQAGDAPHPVCVTCDPDCSVCRSRVDVRWINNVPMCPRCRGDV